MSFRVFCPKLAEKWPLKWAQVNSKIFHFCQITTPPYQTLHFAGFTLAVWMVIADSAQAEYCTTFPSPCAEIDKKIVPVTGARQFMSNNWLILQKLPEAHKVVLCSPSPFNKNTHPLIYWRGSGHQKSESVNTQWRGVMFVTDWIEIFVSKLWLLWWFGGFKINLWASERAWEGQLLLTERDLKYGSLCTFFWSFSAQGASNYNIWNGVCSLMMGKF